MWYKLGQHMEERLEPSCGMIAIRMTSDQLSEAKKLAREWKPEN
jgi:hypothetical protein